jgi:hypothetical protein
MSLGMLVTLHPLGNWGEGGENTGPYMILKQNIKVFEFEKINCVPKPKLDGS